MKKTALTLVLFGAASAASAQSLFEADPNSTIAAALAAEAIAKDAGGIPVIDVDGQEAAAHSRAQAVLLHGIHQQLVQMNMRMHQNLVARATPARVCSYEDRSYSEGSVRPVGSTQLICVEREWGVYSLGAPRELVWEPSTSKRLALYHRATGAAPSSK